MSRNLCTSTCCENTVRLSNLRGKPIEFRRYGSEPPQIGTRWDCPSCQTAYFVIWRDGEWSSTSHKWVRGFVLDLSYYESYNDEHNYDDEKMASEVGITLHKTTSWDILKAWQQKNPGKLLPISQDVACLCLDDAEDAQDVW